MTVQQLSRSFVLLFPFYLDFDLAMNNQYIHTTVLSLSFVVSLFLLPGCSSTVPLTAEDLQQNPTENIVVSTRDGRRISFAGGDYSLKADSLGGQAIIGKGKLFYGNNPQFVRFEGTLPARDIENISTSAKNALFYILIGTTGIILAIALYMRSMGSLGG
jgi:hypothetical protein